MPFLTSIISNYRSSIDGVFKWRGETIKYCENTSDCKDFFNLSSGFCNFDFITTGFCENCIDFPHGSCSEAGFHCEQGLEECLFVCEGIDRFVKCVSSKVIRRHYIFKMLLVILYLIS